MYSLVYVSRRNFDFDVDALVKDAAKKNQRLNITGYLCLNRETFFQYLEGERDYVVKLMEQIQQDKRHQVINQIETAFKERLFPNWHMRYLGRNELIEIKLEHILQNVLLEMRGHIFDNKDVAENAQRLIKKIAAHMYQN